MSPHRRLFFRNSMINLDIKRDLLPLKTPLFRLALRILLDRPEAEDIVQDVLVKIWEMRNTKAFLEIKNLETYALTGKPNARDGISRWKMQDCWTTTTEKKHRNAKLQTTTSSPTNKWNATKGCNG